MGRCDLYNKKVQDKKDDDLYGKGCEYWNMKSLAFIFEKKDLDSKMTKNLRVWSKSSVNWDRDNFVPLTY